MGLLMLVAGPAWHGCKQSVSIFDYCEQRHAAWERAFPERAPNGEAFVDACTGALERSAPARVQCRYACFRSNVLGGRDPRAEYAAMTACETTCTGD